MIRHGLATALLCLLVGAAVLAQGAAPQPGVPDGKKADKPTKAGSKEPTTRDLLAWLQEPIDVTPFQKPMNLKEGLDKFAATFAAGGQELPLLIDREMFKEENPDAPDLDDTQIQFQKSPRRMTADAALRLMLAKIPTNNATFLVRRGCIEITTHYRAAPARLFETPVATSFTKRPLTEVLEALADQTGATIVVDPRAGEKAQSPITATFRNSVSLEAAVRLLAEIAGLQVHVKGGEILFLTNTTKESGKHGRSDLDLSTRPLKWALRDLAEWSRSSVLLDPRAEHQIANPPFVCSLTAGTPRPSGITPRSLLLKADTSTRAAVCLVAESVGLEAVFVENAAIITTHELAKEMKARLPKDPTQGSTTPK